MPNLISPDLYFILTALLVSALLGFFIGWLMKSEKLNTLKKSIEEFNRKNEELKNFKKLNSSDNILVSNTVEIKNSVNTESKTLPSYNKEQIIASANQPTKNQNSTIKKETKVAETLVV